MKVINAFKRLDILGQPVTVNMNGDSKFRTVPGALLSLVVFATGLLSTYFILYGFFDTTNPAIVQEYAETSLHPEASLIENQMLPAYALYNEATGQSLPVSMISKYLTIRATHRDIKVNLATGQVNYTFTPIAPVPCATRSETSSWGYQYLKDHSLERISMLTGICLDVLSKDLKIGGSLASGRSQVLTVDLLPCSLASGCATPAEMQTILILHVYSINGFKTSELEKPITKLPISDVQLKVNEGNVQYTNLKFQLNKVIDNSGFLSKDVLRTEYVDFSQERKDTRSRNSSQTECTVAEIDARICKPYHRIQFESSGRSMITFRGYKGITETLSRLGGIYNILLVAGTILYTLYHSKAQENFILEKVFSLTRNREDILQRFKHAAVARKEIVSPFTPSPLMRSEVQGAPSPSNGSPKEGIPKEAEYRRKFCCPKKTKEELFVHQFESAARNMIKKNLDAVALIKEISTVKAMASLLFKAPHMRLLSFLSVNSHMKKIEAKKNKGIATISQHPPERSRRRKNTRKFEDYFTEKGAEKALTIDECVRELQEGDTQLPNIDQYFLDWFGSSEEDTIKFLGEVSTPAHHPRGFVSEINSPGIQPASPKKSCFSQFVRDVDKNEMDLQAKEEENRMIQQQLNNQSPVSKKAALLLRGNKPLKKSSKIKGSPFKNVGILPEANEKLRNMDEA